MITSLEGDPLSCQSFDTTAIAEAVSQVQQPTVRISAVSFNPITIPRTNGSTTLTVQISSTPGVPANTVVQVETFQNTNPDGVSLVISPLDGGNNAIISSPGTVATVTFEIITPSTNTKPGKVTYQARILSVTSGNPAVTVQTGAAQNNGISNELTVQ